MKHEPREPRVLHIVPSLFGTDGKILGGAERYALELSKNMAAHVPTTLLSFGDAAREEAQGPLKVRVLGCPWYVRGQRFNPLSLAMLPELNRADVVHCYQQHVAASSFAAIVTRFLRRRVFVSDLGGGGWDLSAYVSTDRWYHGHLHISEYSRKVYGHQTKPWAHIILGGVDTAKFSMDPSIKRDGTAVFAGRLLPHKGIDDLIDALPESMPLHIIGQPLDRRFLNDLRAIGAGKRVTFRHDCEDAELIDEYRRALCVVLPSVYKTRYGAESKVPELLGQTLLEGMACGAPAICTAVASMPEIVQDGVTGFIVPPNDPATLGERLEWLRDHPERAREMGQAARQRVLERFTWLAVVRRCLEIYAG